MIRFSPLLTRAAAAAMLGSLLVLAGCHRGSTKDEISAAQAQGQFDTVIKAYKSGQFLVDGAVLSALDTGSHFAYLKDQGKLPKTVLLERSDDSKVRKQHLQYMARMQLDYGFTVYYDDDGTLKKINPVATKARRLEDYRAPVQMNDEQRGKSAADSTYGDPTQQH
ncbi:MULTISPECIES: hypothetical protein [unclassified Rhodanobacter]|uniref:hypothetical protein n=1 Tax=unclassified Rhodanobacter TaxID=2621553 RepID=UPI001BDF09E0|nr:MULTISPECIES: hypothetical protein [unclassified Rhodanobacter]MBT2142874.1 hypothetical protein [Rhodanobacter sp. LX-99]MBT2148053.1 hypothetical protein [Rhodanobacter sp. LX-100]